MNPLRAVHIKSTLYDSKIKNLIRGPRLIGPPEEYRIFRSDPAVLSSPQPSLYALSTYILHVGQRVFSLRNNALVIPRTL
jgi:hypothetical protein